ncbi:MAG TPA: polysaccharide deacetylase family protein [Opitutaceae bacterium]|nr:polysaccharide deacetylase family protein [Opitutaceae bacterium]
MSPGAVILLYHRISEVRPDPQWLAVAPSRFREQLAVLREIASPISMSQLADGLAAGKLPPRAVAVTFDDGYRDNLEAAKPALENFGVPATVFVASGYTAGGREFWWDEVERAFLEPGELPPRVEFDLGDKTAAFELGEARRYTAQEAARHAGWNVTAANYPTRRHEIYGQVCELLRGETIERRERALQGLRAAAGLAEAAPRETHGILDAEGVGRLARGGLVEVGAHTVNHPRLATLPPSDQEYEIEAGKRALERILGLPVAGLAYPFGDRADYDHHCIAAAARSGYRWACANVAGVAWVRSGRYELPRILVRDWDGPAFRQFLEEWL